MEITGKTLTGHIVAENYNLASFFEKYGIDYCCGGNKSIAKSCEERNLNVIKILEELEEFKQQTKASERFKNWDINLLIDYIYQNHHSYIEEKIPEILSNLDKVCKAHAKKYTELNEINSLFKISSEGLTTHLKKEELMLFPQIKKINKAYIENCAYEKPSCGSIEVPINQMLKEHIEESNRFKKIAELTNDYTPPRGACNTFKVTYFQLKEFEEDLHKHIHLENNILFKKAIEIEKIVS